MKNINKNPTCLSDETIAEFVDGLLTGKESAAVEDHLSVCLSCQELVSAHQSVRQRQESGEMMDVPTEMMQNAKNLIREKNEDVLELLVRFSENMFEAIRTTGEVLWGPGVQSDYVLRADTAGPAQVLVVQKDFAAFRVEATVSREENDLHNVFVRLHSKSQKPFSASTNVSLWQDRNELESHPVSRGEISFRKIKPGAYHLRIEDPQNKIRAVIALQLIKI